MSAPLTYPPLEQSEPIPMPRGAPIALWTPKALVASDQSHALTESGQIWDRDFRERLASLMSLVSVPPLDQITAEIVTPSLVFEPLPAEQLGAEADPEVCLDKAIPQASDDPEILAQLVEAGNIASFLKQAKGIIWVDQPADTFARVARLAFNVGAYRLAREITNQGAQKYPDHPELQKLAFILAPPRIRWEPAQPSDVEANVSWIRQHLDDYSGQWVALRDGQLVGAAETLEELKTLVGQFKGLLVTRI